MKRDLDQVMTGLNGEPLPGDLTLGKAIFMAVTTPLKGDEESDGETKMILYGLAAKVHKGGRVGLSAEEIALVKERIGRMFIVELVGCAWGLLEQDAPGEPPPSADKIGDQ